VAGERAVLERDMRVLIYGASDLGRVLKRVVIDIGATFIGYIDDWHTGVEIVGSGEALGDWAPEEDLAILIGVGYRHFDARDALLKKLQRLGYAVPCVVHPSAVVSKQSDAFAAGSVIMAGANVDAAVSIGPLTVIWPNAVISHDCALRGNTFLSPNSTLCGFVNVGEKCFIGAGAIVTDHVHVPESTFVKAGSVFSGTSIPRMIKFR